MDFDESDESIEEEDELDAGYWLTNSAFSIACKYRKEPALDEGKDP